MPKFKVEANSKYTAEETYKKIKEMLESDKELRKLDSYTCNFNDSGLAGKAKGNKFEADMKVIAANGSTQVQIEVNLPLMLTPIKGLVESTLRKKLDSTLA